MKKELAYFLIIIIIILSGCSNNEEDYSTKDLKDGTVINKSASSELKPNFPYRQKNDQILVRFRESTSQSSRYLIHSRMGSKTVKEFKSIKGLQLVKLSRNMKMKKALGTYNKMSEVCYAEPNYVVNALQDPNDPRFNEQWALNNTGQNGGIIDADIDALEAWDITTGSKDAIVAVIDTGVDYTHPDLELNMFYNTADCNKDGIDDDGNGYVDDCHGINIIDGNSDPMDDNGHGTHVAGIIGAAGNNDIGVVGVNWITNIIACKNLDSDGYGTVADAIVCLDYIATMKDRGVNIVATNNSWGGCAYSQALYDAIDEQRHRGILFITAAGNNGLDNEVLQTYPAFYYLPNIISVASTRADDYRSLFSNYGKCVVHIGAPGEAILSTIPGGYDFNDGTSMAAPFVTGIVNLIYSYYSDIDWRSVKNRILASGDINDSLKNRTVTGRRINAYKALNCNNSIVLSRLRPLGSKLFAAPGEPIEIAALHINCADSNGNVIVIVSPINEKITLLDNGLDNDKVAGDGIYTSTWTPMYGGTFLLNFPNSDCVTVNVDKNLQLGFPVKAWHEAGTYSSGQKIHTLIANVNSNSALEIFVSSSANGPLNAWDSSGKLLHGWPVSTIGYPYPAAGNISNMSEGYEIFIGSFGVFPEDGYLKAINGLGELLDGWPIKSANYVSTPPSLSDVDGDGLDEIFIEEEDWGIHAYNEDCSSVPGWPVYQHISGQTFNTSAIADLDEDGDLEIITVGSRYLFAYHHTGESVSGFPFSLEGSHISTIGVVPVVGDVDGDVQKEIIICIKILYEPTLLIISNIGVIKNSISLTGSYEFGTAPALADLDNDGIPEIFVQTDEALNVVRGDGTNYPGWPVEWDIHYMMRNSSPVVGDVDGDGIPEIVVISDAMYYYEDSIVHVYKSNGSLHPEFPKRLPLGSGAVPAIADIDADGHNEIIVSGDYWNGIPGYYDKVWVYDLGGPKHGPVLWGQFMGNEKHTGTSLTVYPVSKEYYSFSLTTIGKGTVISNPPGIYCGSDCSKHFLSGTSLILTAIPASGYQFKGWGGDFSDQQSNSCTVILDSDKSTSAEFEIVSDSKEDNEKKDNGGSSKCFIATASYGSPFASEVLILRKFRDEYLAKNIFGQKFISLYYKYSPNIANYIRDKELLRTIVRFVLWPVITSVKYPIIALIALLLNLLCVIITIIKSYTQVSLSN